MSRAPVDYAAKVRGAWGEDAPEWVLALADECRRTSQSRAATKLGIGASTVSQVLSRSYGGDMERIADLCAGLLVTAIVRCPVLGEIGRDACTRWQQLPFAASDSTRVKVYHACRRGCPNARPSLIERADARGEAA